LWRDEVQALMSPTHVTLARWKRGLRRRVTGKLTVRVTPCAESPAWMASTAALTEALMKPEWTNADLKVILSNHFVLYEVIPWNDALKDEAEQTAYAREYFGLVYGRMKQDWALQIGLDRAGCPYVASGTDQGLLDELSHAADQHKLRLRSVQPLLTETFNHSLAHFTDGAQWFVVVEDGMLCAALVGRRHVIAVRSMRVRWDSPSELAALLEREQLLTDEASSVRKVFLYIVNGPEMPLPTNRWDVHYLPWPTHARSVLSVLPCVH
jgi:hypothetical protein